VKDVHFVQQHTKNIDHIDDSCRSVLTTRAAAGRRKQYRDHQQQSSHYNRAVGHVERRPVVIADVEIQKIGDRSFCGAIPQIACGSAEYQAERNGRRRELRASSMQENENHGNGG
jgi:hypothetical protein